MVDLKIGLYHLYQLTKKNCTQILRHFLMPNYSKNKNSPVLIPILSLVFNVTIHMYLLLEEFNQMNLLHYIKCSTSD